eukprot:403374200
MIPSMSKNFKKLSNKDQKKSIKLDLTVINEAEDDINNQSTMRELDVKLSDRTSFEIGLERKFGQNKSRKFKVQSEKNLQVQPEIDDQLTYSNQRLQAFGQTEQKPQIQRQVVKTRNSEQLDIQIKNALSKFKISSDHIGIPSYLTPDVNQKQASLNMPAVQIDNIFEEDSECSNSSQRDGYGSSKNIRNSKLSTHNLMFDNSNNNIQIPKSSSKLIQLSDYNNNSPANSSGRQDKQTLYANKNMKIVNNYRSSSNIQQYNNNNNNPVEFDDYQKAYDSNSKLNEIQINRSQLSNRSLVRVGKQISASNTPRDVDILPNVQYNTFEKTNSQSFQNDTSRKILSKKQNPFLNTKLAFVDEQIEHRNNTQDFDSPQKQKPTIEVQDLHNNKQ